MLLWVMGVRFESTCTVPGNEMSPVLFQDFGRGIYKIIRLT